MVIAYIYDRNDTVVTQLFGITNFRCRSLLNDIGTASFDLDPREDGVGCSNLKEFRRCRVAVVVPGVIGTTESTSDDKYWSDLSVWVDANTWMEYSVITTTGKISKDSERTIFDGIIRETIATSRGISVTLNDSLYLLKKKKLYTARTYTNVSVSTILADIIGEMNTRYATWITLSAAVSTLVPNKVYKKFLSVYDVLKDLAESGYEFEIRDKVLYFSNQIGSDKTVDPDFVEFRHESAIPQEINISGYEIRRDSDNIANAVTATSLSGGTTQTDSASIAEYGRIEEVYSVDGDTVSASQKLLLDHKDSVSEVSVTPMTDDFFIANIGDKVAVYIDGGNDMQYFVGSMRVVEKGMTYAGAVSSVDLRLSTNKVSTPTLLDGIRMLKDRVRKIEL